MVTIITENGVIEDKDPWDKLELFGNSRPKLYRIWFNDSNDRREIYRVKAYNINQVEDWLLSKDSEILNLEEYSKEELIDYQDGDDQIRFIGLNSCLDCPYYDLTDKEKISKFKELNGEILEDSDIICEYCNNYEGLTIEEFKDPDKEDYELKTIYGKNDYIDLTITQ